jgi:hypothetical protein
MEMTTMNTIESKLEDGAVLTDAALDAVSGGRWNQREAGLVMMGGGGGGLGGALIGSSFGAPGIIVGAALGAAFGGTLVWSAYGLGRDQGHRDR